MNKKTVNFTKSELDSITLPEKGRAYVYDGKVSGLLLQVTASGAKTFQVYKWMNNKPVRVTLGRYPGMTIEQARKQAYQKLSEMAEGVNPNQAKRAERVRGVTLGQCLEQYLSIRSAAGKLKTSTVEDYRKEARLSFADWLDKPMTGISRDMVAARHRKRGQQSPARANLSMRLLRALFYFAQNNYEDENGEPLMPINPVGRISKNKAWFNVERRDTVIKSHQIKAWFEAVMALESDTARDYLLLLLFTGLRRSEGARLEWEHVDLVAKTLKIPDTKNRMVHKLPLSDFLMELFERLDKSGRFVFPAATGKTGYFQWVDKSIAQVVERSGVEFTCHDLRRTFVTVAESLDIPAYALKRLLNHKMNHDVTAGYIVADVERLREPMQKIADFLLKSAGVKASATVINLIDKRA